MRKLTLVGSNLFRIAAQQLNDATQWWRIAQLNGLSDPFGLGVAPPGGGAVLGTDGGIGIIADPGGQLIAVDGGTAAAAAAPVTLIIPDPDRSVAGQGVPTQ